MFKYVKGDIFKLAPKDAYLLHACNCQGVWGSGVAWQFRNLYPEDYIDYKEHSLRAVIGDFVVTRNNVICLYTSNGYGSRVDHVDIILKATELALDKLAFWMKPNTTIYSPKINSGLFKTPWEQTEKLINEFLKKRPDIKWTVVEYEQ